MSGGLMFEGGLATSERARTGVANKLGRVSALSLGHVESVEQLQAVKDEGWVMEQLEEAMSAFEWRERSALVILLSAISLHGQSFALSRPRLDPAGRRAS